MLSRVVERRGGVKNGFLGKVEHLGNIQGKSSGAFHNRFDFLKRVLNQPGLHIGNTRVKTDLEISHKRRNFLFQSLIGDRTTSQIDLVSDQNDGDLYSARDQQLSYYHATDEHTLTPSLLNNGNQYSATLSNVLGSAIE